MNPNRSSSMATAGNAGGALTSGSEAGLRNAKGEWQPPYPVKYPPMFVWPPRLLALLKWFLGYGGFLVPWNLFFLGISVFTWFFLQPAMSRCVRFQADWIVLLFLRNLGLLWFVYGGWHLVLYTLKFQGTERKYDARWQAAGDPKFLFHNQVYDNIFWSCVSGCTVWTAYEATYLWACANQHVPYVSFAAHPVYCVLMILVIPFWRNFHFYWIHRLIHWQPLYRTVHYLHHKNINVGPWSGLAMHPVEHVLYFSVVLIHWVVPSHPFVFLFHIQHTALGPANSHHGFEGPILGGKLPTGSYFHYLHHRYFNCNYGEVDVPLDRWFGTARDTLFGEPTSHPKSTLDVATMGSPKPRA